MNIKRTMNSKNKIFPDNELIGVLVKYFQKREYVPTQEREDRLWARISAESSALKRKRRIRRISFWVSSAAAIFIGLFFLLPQNQLSDSSLMAYVQNYVVDKQDHISDEIILFYGNKQKVLQSDSYLNLKYTSEGKRIILSGQTADITHLSEEELEGSTENGTGEEFDRIVIPEGKNMRLVLSDGSVMHLNSSTMAVFPSKFAREHREIYVDGEAYLDVTPNKEAPFVVKTSHFDVRVLGTAFNVNTYNRQLAKVTLVRGKVELKADSGNKMQLTPNEQASILASGKMEKKTVDPSAFIGWTDPKLQLDSLSFSQLVDYLENHYNVSIAITPEQGKIQLHGTLRLDKKVEVVLHNISFISSIRFEKTETNAYIAVSE